eukprot:1674537-Amphidinium_carterae.1
MYVILSAGTVHIELWSKSLPRDSSNRRVCCEVEAKRTIGRSQRSSPLKYHPTPIHYRINSPTPQTGKNHRTECSKF